MADPPPPKPRVFPGIPLRLEEMRDYQNLDSFQAWVYHPQHQEHLRRIFRYALDEERRVTFRGGAHSFDSQSLSHDIVISMGAFDSIEILSNTSMRVGPGATWGRIVAELEPLGLMPKVTVTGSDTTAGGTLSGDCLSRFSPAYGKEGEHIESFELLRLNGAPLTCRRPPHGQPPSNLSERAFYGVISGLGYLGAVTSITYDIHSLPQRHGPIGVKTSAQICTGFGETVETLLETMREMYYDPNSSPANEDLPDAVYATIYVDPRGGDPSGVVWTSTVTQDTARNPLPINQRFSTTRLAAEFGMRTEWGSRFGWKYLCRMLEKASAPWIYDLPDYTFLMDGNARAKRIGRSLGLSMKGIQQSFVVPNDPIHPGVAEDGARPNWEQGKQRLVEFFDVAFAQFGRAGLSPTLTDVLFLPEDDRFLLSATEGRSGFVVSFAFETSNSTKLEKAEAVFRDLSDRLWEDFAEGRVYLVKNVRTNQGKIAEMYGDNRTAFLALKEELDPDGLLRNEFFRHLDGAPFPPERGPVPARVPA